MSILKKSLFKARDYPFQEWIGQSFGLLLQVVNISSLLFVPVTVINLKRDHLGPGSGTLATFFYTVLFLKLWSYVQVNLATLNCLLQDISDTVTP